MQHSAGGSLTRKSGFTDYNHDFFIKVSSFDTTQIVSFKTAVKRVHYWPARHCRRDRRGWRPDLRSSLLGPVRATWQRGIFQEEGSGIHNSASVSSRCILWLAALRSDPHRLTMSHHSHGNNLLKKQTNEKNRDSINRGGRSNSKTFLSFEPQWRTWRRFWLKATAIVGSSLSKLAK